MSFFQSEEERKIRDLKRRMDYEQYQHEQEVQALNRRIQQNAREWSEYAQSERDDVSGIISEIESRLDKLEQFLRKIFTEKWDSFEKEAIP